MLADREYEDVYGITYAAGVEEMAVTEQAIQDRLGRGFKDAASCAEFAHDIHVDLMMLSKTSHSYLAVDHRGYPLKPTEWALKYRSLLYYHIETEEGLKPIYWKPDAYYARNNARLNSEETDGLSEPLYYRDYNRPYGYFNGRFNTAHPFKYFAKETGADTSFIYTFLEHLARENTPYLLAWLRQKMCNPYKKTEVMPVFVGAQGTGKSTFGEVICKALFGEDNVLVSYQFDSSSRFNSDFSDALVVSIEEKMQDDRRNNAAALKSSTTATHVRKEQKGIDPSYQKSYTEYIISTNDDVPLKFEDGADQRRFMIMEADSNFTRAKSALADNVFTQLYGTDGVGNTKNKALIKNREVVEQFKHELYSNQEIAETNPKDFIRTDAFHRCFALPRTNEAVEIEMIIKALAPFIQRSLIEGRLIDTVLVKDEDEDDKDVTNKLEDIIALEGIVFVRHRDVWPDRIALCRPLVFAEQYTAKPYAHSVVEKTLRTARQWLRDEYNIELLPVSNYPSGGFKAVISRYKRAPTAWFSLVEPTIEDDPPPPKPDPVLVYVDKPKELPSTHTYRARYGTDYQPALGGCFETLNPIPIHTMDRRSSNASRLDTFLLEADSTTEAIRRIEHERIQKLEKGKSITAEKLYAERLRVQEEEAQKLIDEGIAWRVVYSGAKSLHILVTVAPAPQTLEERKWLDVHLKTMLGKRVSYDMSTSDPTRLTRYPFRRSDAKSRTTGVEARHVIGKQYALVIKPEVAWQYNWRPLYEQWLQRPLTEYEHRGKRMLPAKQIYIDAAKSIMEGRFFSDATWDGRRQETFFPAYRLVRALGFTADEVWEELEKDVENYAQDEKEKQYWRSRRTGKLILSIDAEFDNIDEE